MSIQGQVIPLLASASRAAAAYNSEAQASHLYRGVTIFLDISDVGAAGTVDCKIQVQDPVSGNFIDLAGGSFAQQVATGTDMLTVYPGIAETANVSVSDALPAPWRVVLTVGVNAVTASVTAVLIP